MPRRRERRDPAAIRCSGDRSRSNPPATAEHARTIAGRHGLICRTPVWRKPSMCRILPGAAYLAPRCSAPSDNSGWANPTVQATRKDPNAWSARRIYPCRSQPRLPCAALRAQARRLPARSPSPPGKPHLVQRRGAIPDTRGSSLLSACGRHLRRRRPNGSARMYVMEGTGGRRRCRTFRNADHRSGVVDKESRCRSFSVRSAVS